MENLTGTTGISSAFNGAPMADNATPSDVISGFYTSILKRDADAAGLDAWLEAYANGTPLETIKQSLIGSGEATQIVDPLVRLYQAAFGRLPDDAGLNGWADALRAGASLHDVAAGFVGSDEFLARFPNSSSGDQTAFITALYQQTLGRAPDADGLAGWLASGLSPADLLIGFSESPEFKALTDDPIDAFLSALADGQVPNPAHSLFDPIDDIGSNNAAAPVVDLNGADDGFGFAATYTAGDAPIAIAASDLTIADADDTLLKSATITLTGAADGSSEALSLAGTLPDGISIVSSSATSIELTGSASLADYQTAISLVRYLDDASTPTPGDRTVSVVVNDGELTSDIAISTVTVETAAPPNDGSSGGGSGGGGGAPVNTAPSSLAFGSPITSIAEDADTSSATKIADIVVTDDGLGSNELSLSGADADSFEIVGTALFLKAGVKLDYEKQTAFDISVNVDDSTVGATPDASAALTLTVTDVLDSIELSQIQSSSDPRGFVINGVAADDRSGFSVSSAGDVNGDGLDDLIVGTSGSEASFVVFGKTDGDAVDLSAFQNPLNKSGFVINGVSADDHSGRSVSSAGDVNGDGLDDLIVGAYGADPHDEGYDGADPHYKDSAGASFVVFGKDNSEAVDLSAFQNPLNKSGFVINGVSADDFSGSSVSSAGDVNGDGLDDLIVGADGADPHDESYDGADPHYKHSAGASFVVFGKADDTNPVELSAVQDSSNDGGFVINGVSELDRSGHSVSSAGDVNGDGLDDLIVGADGADPHGERSGASFVVFGKDNGEAVDLLKVADGTGGFVINGVSADDRSGHSVSSAGDVNGDGLDDLIVGAYGDDPNGNKSGASFVVFGKADGEAVDLLKVADGTGGFVINGVSAGDQSGRAVSSAGDVNGDGRDDLIVGADGDDPNGPDSGASFVVFGKADGDAVKLSDVEKGIGGFVINGASAGDRSGHSVSSAGDVNGDGFDDLIVGADGDDPNGSDSGASFVIFGGDDIGASAATLVGTDAGETLNGTDGNDRIIAGQGDDIIVGGGGNDYLVGARGNDTFVFSSDFGDDVIKDFEQGVDLIDLTAFDFGSSYVVTVSQSGSDVIIDVYSDTITILGSSFSDWTSADFTFASGSSAIAALT